MGQLWQSFFPEWKSMGSWIEMEKMALSSRFNVPSLFGYLHMP
jgi:hypothetical protein